ncbi:MAG: hypothetical protein WC553_00795 [Patescibacteria group bacterium]
MNSFGGVFGVVIYFVIPGLTRNLDKKRKRVLFVVSGWILNQVQDDKKEGRGMAEERKDSLAGG